MSKEFLRIKLKSLAAEQRIIRKAAKRHKQISKKMDATTNPDKYSPVEYERHRSLWLDMNSHRRFHVRPIIRSAHLAYAYMRGTPYSKVESWCHEPPNWPEVAKNLISFDTYLEKRMGNLPVQGRVDAVVAKLIEWRDAEDEKTRKLNHDKAKSEAAAQRLANRTARALVNAAHVTVS